MPKAAKSKKPSNRHDPKSKPDKDPKQSHLYTDDNPSTTLHGTGFKDAAAAHHTLELVSRRSLTYQFQTINTMCHRAKGHPHHTDDMNEAIGIFETWLKETYPAEKEARRDFKPVLSKTTVKKYLERLEADKEIDAGWALAYVALEPRKRLANVLTNPDDPKEPDLDRVRTDRLSELVSEEKEKSGFEHGELWDGAGTVSHLHLRFVALAWSPVSERKLP